MTPEISALINHLWQSTVFALAAAGVAFLLRRHAARLRFWIWMAASVKFLVPIGWLVSLGAAIGSRTVHLTATTASTIVTIDEVGRAVTQSPLIPAITSSRFPISSIVLAVWLVGTLIVLALWIVRWARLRIALRRSTVAHGGPLLVAVRRLEHQLGQRRPLRVLQSDATIEPGIVGVLRPALLLPAGIEERLSEQHLDAILAHELCHVRRHDNALALVHMLAEALFWFHPLVWWIGARLVEERERACDEAVLQLGNEAETYAEGILKVCQFYVETSLACASGVTGADLKRRIETIMTHTATPGTRLWQRGLLAAAAVSVVATPVLFGMVTAPVRFLPANSNVRGSLDMKTARLKIAIAPLFLSFAAGAQQPPAPPTDSTHPKNFEVVSIKPGDPSERRVRVMMAPGGRFTGKNVPVSLLLQQAYGVRDFQITGAPSWMQNERFDIEAKADGQANQEDFKAMLQNMLADRFKLKLHRDTREMGVYSLVVGKGGIKMKESPAEGGRDNAMMRMGRGVFNAERVRMDGLAQALSNIIGRQVLDKTGLGGFYEVKLEWTPDETQMQGPREINAEHAAPVDSSGPTIFTAVQEQLGLKLESSKGQVELLIIDSIEKPTAN